MLSRVAENLYWFGRYVQRAENTARLVNVNTYLLLDLPRRVPFGWTPVLEILAAQDRFATLYDETSEPNVVRFLVMDERNPGSILSAVRRARGIMRQSRDVMPREVWERINDLYLLVQAQGEKACSRRWRHDVLSQVINGTILITGLLISSMSRDVGFQFLRLGSSLEQADMTTRILDVRSANLIQSLRADELRPFQSIQWMSVLKSLTAYQMYRRHVRMRVSARSVARFLLQDPEFPRSVLFCLERTASTLAHLPMLPAVRGAQRALAGVTARVRDADIVNLVEDGLSDFLDDVQRDLAAFGGAVSDAYFKT
jgi:uncharacterized alpha-E superfamily protein